ncbi:Extracellular solute-binding protein family 1 [Desulforamulus hydrothermalis Lam5 = DSM 18033]|uniref:Extracellular solute-binding protein family 1 n=1 Tax=Desulforamulus hydrothermalis Lam5 = DSM 18033 TaxID=1121428 RepID=K8E035_9FIRM|nr:extracellular solute-binding protein [Desulforamulus hydrothermalis]CCO08829.1 Extracellular solute-binding protein family 1 [Desulforamulus hydrothermalis Lam5 = DSM 18033]SHG72637.1 carbohydrate ABC transporter substrate-binding protein, CUT1 family [Desulforamulus hydrothermalis Lam5 = DSM 18033]
MKKKLIAILTCLVALTLVLAGCGGEKAKETAKEPAAQGKLVDGPFKKVEGLPAIQAPEGFDWKQFAGVELNVISENTPPSSAIAANIKEFEEATGIKVNIQQMDLGTLVQKVGLDFSAGSSKYHVIYADPYQVLAKYSSKFVDLNELEKDPTLPKIPGGLEDFIQSQLEIDGYMGSKDKLYALPYDCPTMVLAYRTDVMAKIKDNFINEKGFDPTPNPNMTWEQYYQVAEYINKHAAELGVKYGTGHQAKQYDSLMCDFSNILNAYGADYFANRELGGIGAANPGKTALTTPEALQAFEFYNKLLKIAHPGSKSWDWNGLAEAFAAGEVAMAPEWHEFASMFENPEKSKVAGKVAWTTLPKGPKRSANIFGGTGIGINANASEKEKKAAWLFLVWATSPQTQLMILESPVGGATPSRTSVYNVASVKKAMEDPASEEAKKMPNLTSMKATLEAWKAENAYGRPKVPQWPQIDTIVFTELSKMLAGQQDPKTTAESISKQVDALTGN